MMISNTANKNRNYQLDNIRAILIFLVVLGHLIPSSDKDMQGKIVNFIYSFHMAVFVYTNGYYAHFNRNKIVKHYIWPYLFFQTAYYYFYTYILIVKSSLQITTPHFTLWYLLTIGTYYCLIPLLQVNNRKQAIIVIFISFISALAVGFDETVGPYLSLSRTIVFLPFFLLGLYRDILIDRKTAEKLKNKWLLAIAIILVICLEIIIWHSDVELSTFRFDNYYSDINMFPPRFISEILGFLWIYILFQLVTTKKTFILSNVGQNTMPIYLLHGFIVRLVSHYQILSFDPTTNTLLALAMCIVIVLMFGNSFFGKIFKKLF